MYVAHVHMPPLLYYALLVPIIELSIPLPPVHDETKCHIHFPDSNRSVHGEKSNQVSITGQVSAVETARKRIRVSHAMFIIVG